MNLVKSDIKSMKEYIVYATKYYVDELVKNGWDEKKALSQSLRFLGTSPLFDITVDDKKVGWIELVSSGDILLISNLVIIDKRKGYAYEIVECLKKMFPDNRIHSVLLSTNSASRGLHEKLGFRIIGHYMEYVEDKE